MQRRKSAPPQPSSAAHSFSAAARQVPAWAAWQAMPTSAWMLLLPSASSL
jgi:hypothetical protein